MTIDLLVTIATVARAEGASYIENTCKSISRGRQRDIPNTAWVIIEDGGAPGRVSFKQGRPWSVRPTQPAPIDTGIYPAASGGCLLSLWRAFEIASQVKAKQLLYLEDDVVSVRDFVPYLLSLDWESEILKDFAFLDLCDFKEMPRNSPDGIYPMSTLGGPPGGATHGFHGVQAALFPARTIEWLHQQGHTLVPSLNQQREWHMAYGQYLQGPKPCDMILGAKLQESPWLTYGVHLPCLFDHVGVISACNPSQTLRRGRVATNFPGEKWSARALMDVAFVPHTTSEVDDNEPRESAKTFDDAFDDAFDDDPDGALDGAPDGALDGAPDGALDGAPDDSTRFSSP